jgi:hypothetical protein
MRDMNPHTRPQRPYPARTLGEHSRDDSLHRITSVRRLACKHLVSHRSKGVEIAARIYLALAGGLLGTHVLRSAKRQSSLREPPTTSARYSESNSKISYERMTIVKENVLRLYVAMYHAVTVRIPKSASHFARNAKRVIHRQLTLAVEARPK